MADDSFGAGASDTLNCDICEGSGRTKTIEGKCEVVVPFNVEIK